MRATDERVRTVGRKFRFSILEDVGVPSGTPLGFTAPMLLHKIGRPLTETAMRPIREGQLAKLAGEGAGGETLASRSAGLYNPPAKPPRPFVDDYPLGAPVDATGRLIHDIEGRPLTARYIAGRS